MSDSTGTPQEVRYTLAPTRLGPIPEDQMTAVQKADVDAVMSGPRKHMGGPFSALLRSPELMNRVQKVGEQGVIDILAVAGYYGLLALVMKDTHCRYRRCHCGSYQKINKNKYLPNNHA